MPSGLCIGFLVFYDSLFTEIATPCSANTYLQWIGNVQIMKKREFEQNYDTGSVFYRIMKWTER